MGIIGYDGGKVKGSTTRESRPHKPSMDISSIIERDNTIDKYIQFLEGSDWSTTYFNKLMTKDELNVELDVNAPITTTSYDKISNMIIKTQSDLTVDGNDALTGTGIVFGITPLINDYFHANLLYGREGLFKVTEVVEKNYRHNPVYEISYKLDSYVDVSRDRLDLLLAKSGESLVYEDGGVIITEKSFVSKYVLIDKYREISDYYIESFYRNRNEIHCLTIKGDIIIDTDFSKFVRDTMHTENRYLLYTNRLSGKFTHDSLWSALNKQNKLSFKRCNLWYGITNAKANFIAYEVTKTIVGLRDKDVRSSLLCDKVLETRTPGDEKTLLPKLKAGEYIFTEEFNTKLTPYSKLEELVRKYFELEVIKPIELEPFLDSYADWSLLERYYYTPIILLMMKYSVERTEKLNSTRY